MSQTRAGRILIIDDSIEHIKILISLLAEQHEVFFAKSGEEGLEMLSIVEPDLILLDIVMPGMNGFETCRHLKENARWRETPLIFISARSEGDDESKGLELGAVDYIAKPFNPAIVRARLNNHLELREARCELKRLHGLALDINPVTGLPGNNSIAQRIEQLLRGIHHVSVMYTDIDNFKAYNDKYGFTRGDEVIRFMAEVLKKAVTKAGCPDAFIGHIGGDDFILTVPAGLCSAVTQDIISKFDQDIITFYNRQDTELRCIQAIDRRGRPQIFPIMSISIAGIDLSYRHFFSYLEVNDACTEMQKMAKAIPGSTVCFDQRRE
ncbi:MAG: response regulator [Desulforhopalus sp.]|nr:response regulator [Desulforhopalus sp.]